MNDGQNAKQQLVERIKDASNILVTVSTNPSVDELAAAMGLTIMLNGMNKHATAVVSGDIPPAITFLEPAKTFENSVDSLRDFIIALDKEKADHLRYKVDGEVVKIFITPYRTTINENDLDFSQGDYNVELVLALNVADKEHLDKALSAHGRILHDATVATLSCGDQASRLGSIDWSDPNASSLSEMLVALSESLKSDAPIIDEQSATAFLTGIVAATDRFSNNRTSSKVMTMAAQLMAAGANQQLIAAKLEEAHEIGPDKSDTEDDDENGDGTTDLEEGASSKVDKSSKKSKSKKGTEKDDGSLAISHEKEGNVDEVGAQTADENQAAAKETAENELAQQLETVAPASAAKPSVEDLKNDLASASSDVEQAADEAVLPPVSLIKSEQDAEAPQLGGTLNATTEQAHDETEQAARDDKNKTILSHNSQYVGDSQPMFQAPFNATSAAKEEPASVDIFKNQQPEVDLSKTNGSNSNPQKAPSVEPQQPEPESDPVREPQAQPAVANETLADLDKKNRHEEHEDAQAAVQAAYNEAPFEPANNPISASGAQPLGDITHASQADGLSYEATELPQPPMPPELPPLPPSEPPQAEPVSAPAPDFSSLPPPPPLPPAPENTPSEPQSEPTATSEGEQSQLGGGAVPPEQLGQIFNTNPQPQAQPPVQEEQSNDPNQFKIPGQP